MAQGTHPSPNQAEGSPRMESDWFSGRYTVPEDNQGNLSAADGATIGLFVFEGVSGLLGLATIVLASVGRCKSMLGRLRSSLRRRRNRHYDDCAHDASAVSSKQ